MIRIERSRRPPKPKGSRSRKKEYRRKEVVEALWTMQKEKCCYCECRIPKEGHLKAVEHFRPQSIYKDRVNDWENLLLACAQCNGKKSDKFPLMLTSKFDKPKVVYVKTTMKKGEPCIIDPSDPKQDPETHIRYELDDTSARFGIPFGKTRRGRITVKVVGLGDVFFAKKRAFFALDTLSMQYNNLKRAQLDEDPERLDVQKRVFQSFMSARHEFAAFARAFARHKKLDKPPIGLNIPVGAEV